MKIMLFGVSNVGKTTIGKIIAEKLNYKFYDLDDEVKKYYNVTLEEFVNSGSLEIRDQKRGEVIKDILKKDENLVFAISPISYPNSFKRYLKSEENLLIMLTDAAENIFDRLVFSDENDDIYTDENYKNKYKKYLIDEINEDLYWYSEVYAKAGVTNIVYVENETQEAVADRIIDLYNLR